LTFSACSATSKSWSRWGYSGYSHERSFPNKELWTIERNN